MQNPIQGPPQGAFFNGMNSQANPQEMMPEAVSSGQEAMFPNFIPSEAEQLEIVGIANKLKASLKSNAKPKKEKMQKCYAYAKSQMVDGDLLPTIGTTKNANDANKDRPAIFIPVMRQQMKQLFSYLKLTMFPNDQDYFRVRATDEDGVQLEQALTEGLKVKFRQAMISEKIGRALYDTCWAGTAAVHPCIKDDVVWEWQYDHQNRRYVPTEVDLEPLPDVETFNPLDFYLDPNAKDPDRAKWGHFTKKKVQELKDSNLYFNKDKLKDASSKDSAKDKSDNFDLSKYNDLNNTFEDTEDNIEFDLYYFPFLKTKTREYRNMLLAVAGGKVMCRFHPNTFPRGMNPLVSLTWMQDVDSAYGTGPGEDIMELQRLINILYNHMIETLARIGNRFKATSGVDVSNLFGVAGGVAILGEPTDDIQAFTGDYTEPMQLQNVIGVLKAEAQMTSGSQNPFQGSSNIDFKKTATELQIMQENSISVMREVIEHLSTRVQRILECLMYLCADLYKEPVKIRIDDPTGPRYIEVDFSVLRSGKFTIELVSVNPSQSKQAQVESLMQLMELMAGSPEMLDLMAPIVSEIGKLQGIKDIDNKIEEIRQKMGVMQNAQGQPGIPPDEAGMGAGQQPPMDAAPPPPPEYLG